MLLLACCCVLYKETICNISSIIVSACLYIYFFLKYDGDDDGFNEQRTPNKNKRRGSLFICILIEAKKIKNQIKNEKRKKKINDMLGALAVTNELCLNVGIESNEAHKKGTKNEKRIRSLEAHQVALIQLISVNTFPLRDVTVRTDFGFIIDFGDCALFFFCWNLYYCISFHIRHIIICLFIISQSDRSPHQQLQQMLDMKPFVSTIGSL